MLIPPPNSVHPKTRAGWRRWLQAHHTQTGGVWLIMFKKAAAKNIRAHQWRPKQG